MHDLAARTIRGSQVAVKSSPDNHQKSIDGMFGGRTLVGDIALKNIIGTRHKGVPYDQRNPEGPNET